MNDSGGDRNGAVSPEPEGRRGYRRRQLALDRAHRRRRLARRLSVLGVVLLLAAGVFAVVSSLDDEPEEVSEVLAAEPGMVLLLLTEPVEGAPEQVQVAVLLGAGTEPTMVLGMPGNTLLEGPEGFDPLVELVRDYGPEALDFGAMFPDGPSGTVSLPWKDLRELLVTEEGSDPLPESLGSGPKAAEAAAQAVARIAAMSGGDRRGQVEDLPIEGDAAEFLDALAALAPAPAVVGGLPGKEVEGVGYAYYEPDLGGIQLLLGGESREGQVEVEVQNGSGVAGIAQRVSNAIAPLNYSMLPAKNADDFPNVGETKIVAAPGVVSDAERIRQALGAGTVVPRESLPANRVVIIVGKDMPVEGLPAADEEASEAG